MDSDAAQLFDLHQAELLKFLESRLGCGQTSRDVAQEAFLKYMEVEPRSAIKDPRAFLFTVAANLARDRQRHGRRWRTVELDDSNGDFLLPAAPSSDRVLAGHEQLRRLEQAVAELPAKCRLVFIMQRIDGLTYREIGRRMSLSETMVRKYAARALVYCHARLSDDAT
jgi:RNA polymerase sigma factor (sigma-70 family)